MVARAESGERLRREDVKRIINAALEEFGCVESSARVGAAVERIVDAVLRLPEHAGSTRGALRAHLITALSATVVPGAAAVVPGAAAVPAVPVVPGRGIGRPPPKDCLETGRPWRGRRSWRWARCQMCGRIAGVDGLITIEDALETLAKVLTEFEL